MPATYDLAKHYAGPDGLVSQSPFWFVGFVRFRDTVTYDRSTKKSKTDVEPLAETTERLVIAHQVKQMTVTNSKSSHISNLQVTFESGAEDILKKVRPGDWVFAWMLADQHEGERVLKLVSEGQPANGWRDGLKFVGRAMGPRKRTSINPETGMVDQGFTMMAVGFSEFNYKVFYEPHLLAQKIVPAHLEEFGLFIHSIVADENQSVMDAGLIDINKVLPALVEVLFGHSGAYSRSGSVDGNKAAPQGALRVPKGAGAWLGVNDAFSYVDILEQSYGIQKYGDSTVHMESTEAPWTNFLPEWQDKLRGQFSVVMPPIMNTPFWSLLGNFLNSPINEMYTSLRANSEGRVMPTLTVRQIPFSRREPKAQTVASPNLPVTQGFAFNPSAAFEAPATTGTTVTKFLELPRWRLTHPMMWYVDVGDSDTLRVNYVHISGIPGVGTGVDETGMFIRCPPIRDDADIERSGLRPYAATVNCTFKDTVVGPTVWRDILADVMMGQHLTLTGSLQTYGIDLPIAPGDNLEYESVVFHIENVTHSCSIDDSGRRRFLTSFQVSNGVEANPANPDEPYLDLSDDVIDGEIETTVDYNDGH